MSYARLVELVFAYPWSRTFADFVASGNTHPYDAQTTPGRSRITCLRVDRFLRPGWAGQSIALSAWRIFFCEALVRVFRGSGDGDIFNGSISPPLFLLKRVRFASRSPIERRSVDFRYLVIDLA